MNLLTRVRTFTFHARTLLIVNSLLFCFASSSAVAQRQYHSNFVDQITPPLEPFVVKPYFLSANSIVTKLQVRESYIDQDKTPWPSDHGPELFLKMLWPSLQSTPIHFVENHGSEERAKTEQMLSEGSYLGIYLSQGRLNRMPDIIDNHVKNDWVAYSVPPAIPGFDRYVDKNTEKYVVGKKWIGEQILVPNASTSAKSIYFTCPINANGTSLRLYCEGHTYFGHFVYGEYTFSSAHISDWKEVDGAVRQIFDGMLIK